MFAGQNNALRDTCDVVSFFTLGYFPSLFYSDFLLPLLRLGMPTISYYTLFDLHVSYSTGDRHPHCMPFEDSFSVLYLQVC